MAANPLFPGAVVPYFPLAESSFELGISYQLFTATVGNAPCANSATHKAIAKNAKAEAIVAMVCAKAKSCRRNTRIK
jgi:hypothetical protein